MSAVSERILSRLDDIGKSSARASMEAGLSESAIRDIVSGKSKSPTLATLTALCGPLECDLGYLVGIGQPQKHESAPAMPRFWMVFGVNQREPRYRHWSEDGAENEARRLAATNPNNVFVVLKAVKAIQCHPNTVEVEICDDEIPF